MASHVHGREPSSREDYLRVANNLVASGVSKEKAVTLVSRTYGLSTRDEAWLSRQDIGNGGRRS